MTHHIYCIEKHVIARCVVTTTRRGTRKTMKISGRFGKGGRVAVIFVFNSVSIRSLTTSIVYFIIEFIFPAPKRSPIDVRFTFFFILFARRTLPPPPRSRLSL